MDIKVIKRDGRLVEFNTDKISNAILEAMSKTEEGIDIELAYNISTDIASELSEDNVTVEEIQDMVEEYLMDTERKDVAKEYITYRAERTRVRETYSNMMNIMEELTYSSAEDSDIKRENANIDGNTAMGTMLKYGTEGAKEFYLNRVLDPRFTKAHRDGDVHFHDLDFLTLTTTCCQINLETLFDGGFSTGHGYLREPKSINSYGALAAIAIQSNQSDQHKRIA